jgi:hypothetical protein
MNRKTFAIAALAVAGALTAGVAEARDRSDVQWSVTLGNPAPVWVRPAPVYSAPVVDYRYDRRYGGRDGRAYYHGDHGARPTRWDRDGDGIPNRYDRVYNPRWDRDGDGVPNRYDHRDNRRGRGG